MRVTMTTLEEYREWAAQRRARMKDEIVREGTAGYIIAFGDATYRCLDAVTRLKKEGIDVGLINKVTLNVVDEEMIAKVGASPMVLVVEPLSQTNGLGAKFGTRLLCKRPHASNLLC